MIKMIERSQASKRLNSQMKYQELKLQLKFHALFILNTYTSLNNNLLFEFHYFPYNISFA